MFHAPDLLHRLIGLRFGRPVYLFQQIGSTNDQARQLAEAGAPEGLLVVAEEQTAGRGRAQRRWLTPPGTALAVSVVLRPALPARLAPRVSMLAGLAVCAAVEHAGLRPELKWPNDVLVNGRKTAGLLAEAAFRGDELDYVIVGVGLNIRWAPDPAQVDFPATCLEAEAGRPLDRLTLLRALLAGLEAHYPQLAEPALVAAWRARLAWLGAPVIVRTAAGPMAGRLLDVDEDGALRFQSETGEVQRVLAGEVSLRPARPD